MMMDKDERVYIGSEGLEQDSPALLDSLPAGTSITLYDEELEVEAVVDIVEHDKGQRIWLGKPNWTMRRDLLPVALSTAQQI